MVAGAAGVSLGRLSSSLAGRGAMAWAQSARERLRITDIETHEILVPFHDFNASDIQRYHGLNIQLRTVFIMKTAGDLEGYGESWGPAPADGTYTQYVGTDPFDWIGDTRNLAMNMAVYDLMGKFLEVPAWKLIGPKVRDWVPVAAWTVSRTPEAMADEVLQVSRMGYRWLKYHIDELQNVVDQTRAMQKVAPPGFRVHYDFNANATVEASYPVLRELEKFPIVGRIEDPISARDPEGWSLLRAKCRLPILVHHGPTDFLTEKRCDGLMAGHAPIGMAQKIAAVAEQAHAPIMLQQAGGTINQAFLAHEAAVFKMATLDHVDLCHLWKDDITREHMDVVGGSVAVPSGPGLGVTIDREKLARYRAAPRPVRGRFLVRVRYEGGPTIYFRHDPDVPGKTDDLRNLNPPYVPGPSPSYANAVATDFWAEEGTREFEAMWKKTESGPAWTAKS